MMFVFFSCFVLICFVSNDLITLFVQSDHPGTNNTFQVACQSELSLSHNDISVLENHHVSVGWKLLRKQGILQDFDAESARELRRMVIGLSLIHISQGIVR